MTKVSLPSYMKRVQQSTSRYVVLLGGRGSAKSASIGRHLLMKCQTEGADVLNGREFMNSIEGSVHKLYKSLVKELDLSDSFDVTDKKVKCMTGGEMAFRGFSRNPDAVKSAEDFKYSWMEEAQTSSQDTLTDLLPTIRKPGSQLFFTANPKSSADPFSKRFIVPYLQDLLKQGYYEDDLHLILMVNWRDNPWHGELEKERQWDFKNKTRALYDHIWEGAFNDSIEDPLILAEWFDACIDAHKELGFKPEGVRMSSHDPSDIGPDSKGFAFRHGSVVTDLQEKIEGNINEGGEWATGLAINHRSDYFAWDCDGMGVGLNAQTAKSFEGKHTTISQFKGSEGVDFPDAIFEAVQDSEIQNQKTNKDALKNKRAQYYYELRKRVYKTYQSINKMGHYHPDELISFDSSINLLPKLRSELCRMPVKPNGNGKFELYSKPEMKTRFKFDSPNLGDSVMILMRHVKQNTNTIYRPPPTKTIGKRR
ncbi:MAG: PBSX family phage terminase large subunit [Bacteroidetes bacterium]|nr:PBSX family phage terminase large subunit [Bacteroidota bacterium]